MKEHPASEAPRTPSRLERRRERNRKLILEGARAVFQRKGYLDATVEDIAEEVDIGRGTFYNYFDSKDDVFHDLVRELVEEMLAIVSSSAVREEPSLRTRIAVGIGGILEASAQHRALLSALNQAVQVNEVHAGMWRDLTSRLEQAVNRDLEWCSRHGLTKARNTPLLSNVLTALLESMVVSRLAVSDFDRTEMRDALVDIYWNALFRPFEGADDYLLARNTKPTAVFLR